MGYLDGSSPTWGGIEVGVWNNYCRNCGADLSFWTGKYIKCPRCGTWYPGSKWLDGPVGRAIELVFLIVALILLTGYSMRLFKAVFSP